MTLTRISFYRRKSTRTPQQTRKSHVGMHALPLSSVCSACTTVSISIHYPSAIPSKHQRTGPLSQSFFCLVIPDRGAGCVITARNIRVSKIHEEMESTGGKAKISGGGTPNFHGNSLRGNISSIVAVVRSTTEHSTD